MLCEPLVEKGAQRLEPAGWDEALALVATKLKGAKPERIAAFAGDLAGAEEMFALKDLLTRLGTARGVLTRRLLVSAGALAQTQLKAYVQMLGGLDIQPVVYQESGFKRGCLFDAADR